MALDNTIAQTKTRAIIELIIGCIVLGTGSLIVKTVDVGSYAITFWRMSIASVCFIGLCLWRRQVFPRQPMTYVFMALAGVFGSLDLSLWHVSIHAVGPGIATLLNSLQIFF